jgi:hypothetical protein
MDFLTVPVRYSMQPGYEAIDNAIAPMRLEETLPQRTSRNVRSEGKKSSRAEQPRKSVLLHVVEMPQ